MYESCCSLVRPLALPFILLASLYHDFFFYVSAFGLIPVQFEITKGEGELKTIFMATVEMFQMDSP